MRIAIHSSKGSFSERWTAYCDERNISYKLVNCYKSDIIKQIENCDGLMWHFNHKSPKDSKFAKQLLFSVEGSGKSVFPDFNSVWHFDDKVGQKYLLEAVNAPLVPTYVFYDKMDARKWVSGSNYPLVFKLRVGAGSDNVQLVKCPKDAYHLVDKAFGRGFTQYHAWRNLKERYRKFRLGKSTFREVLKGFVRLLLTTEYARVTGREKGYVYFQDFIPGNSFDIRVIVIGNRAFAIKRMVRENDFRASGSGLILYQKENFQNEIISVAFQVSEKIKSQCMAYDFVFLDNKPLIVEISYGFAIEGYDACTGYWDRDLTWHEGKFNPYGWMVEQMLKPE